MRRRSSSSVQGVYVRNGICALSAKMPGCPKLLETLAMADDRTHLDPSRTGVCNDAIDSCVTSTSNAKGCSVGACGGPAQLAHLIVCIDSVEHILCLGKGTSA